MKQIALIMMSNSLAVDMLLRFNGNRQLQKSIVCDNKITLLF